MTEQNNHPIRKFRGERGIALAIWENQITDKDGNSRPRNSLTLQRSYRNQDTGEWIQSEINLFPSEVPAVIALLNKAYGICTVTEVEPSGTSS